MARPFRFSLQAVTADSRQEWIDLGKRAEDLGFDALVTADHIGGCMSPLAPLLTIAEHTERLRLGVMVLNNDFHHPSLLAREAATIDLLTDGRLELGLGAGHSKPEYERAGIPFDPPPVRVDRLEEAVPILRQLLDGDTVTMSGRHYTLREERCDPRPVQAHLPILVGGGGRRVLAIAARHADAVGFSGLGRTLEDGQRHEPTGFPPAAVDEQVALVRQVAGERLPELELHALVQGVIVTGDPAGSAEELIRTQIPGLTVDDVLRTPYVWVGTQSGLVERLRADRERWGFSHYTVRPATLDAVSPIVAELAGT